jgi:hypothetical protein
MYKVQLFPHSRIRGTCQRSYIAITSIHSTGLSRIGIWASCDAEHHISVQEEAYTALDKWFGETDGLEVVADKRLW